MKINWKQKLSSRKFWAGVAGWITSLLTAFNVTDNAIAQAGIIVAGIGSLAVYALSEGIADGGRNGVQVINLDGEESDDE